MFVQKPQRVIGPKGHRNLFKVTSCEKGVLCTTCCIISATKDGNWNTSLFLNFGESVRVDESLFVSVMEHFIKHTQSSPTNPSILLPDNHESHLNIEALYMAKKFGVIVITFHPHTSAKMQPLDVGVFGAFKTYYNNAMDSWLLRHPGYRVTIYDIGQLIGIAFAKSMTIENITKSFRKTGIVPFDRENLVLRRII